MSDYGMTEGSAELNGTCCSDFQDAASCDYLSILTSFTSLWLARGNGPLQFGDTK